MLNLTRQQLVLKDKLKKQLAKAFHVITLMPHTFSSGNRYSTNITALYYYNALDTVITATTGTKGRA